MSFLEIAVSKLSRVSHAIHMLSKPTLRGASAPSCCPFPRKLPVKMRDDARSSRDCSTALTAVRASADGGFRIEKTYLAPRVTGVHLGIVMRALTSRKAACRHQANHYRSAGE